MAVLARGARHRCLRRPSRHPSPAGGVGKTITNAPPIYGADQTPAAFLAGEFIRWLGEQDAHWFAHLSFISPHPPFIVPEPYNTLYDPADGPAFARAASWREEAAVHPYLDYLIRRQKKSKFLPGMEGMVSDFAEDEFRAIRALYWGMISEMDAELGRIWEAVKAKGAWDDTIVILTSDHAEMLGDHFSLGKGGFFDQSFHIPLIVRDPGRGEAAGARVDRFTEAVDIMPTLLDLLGATPPAHLDGRSLAPFVEGKPPADWRDAAHWEFDFRSIEKGSAERHFGLKPQQCNLAAIRTEGFKYVHFGGGLPPLLYDLHNDPGELKNLAGDPALLPVRLELAERLLAWRAEYLDQSLALSALTENGIVGTPAALPGS